MGYNAYNFENIMLKEKKKKDQKNPKNPIIIWYHSIYTKYPKLGKFESVMRLLVSKG